jgi:hypothetical protein
MAKISVTLDATKLRNLVTKREYQNKQGEKVQAQEVKFELVEVKEPKEIFKKDNMRIMKTHFASVIQTKEERDSKAPTIYIGEGFTTEWGSPNNVEVHNAEVVSSSTEEHDDLPF